MSKSKKRNIIIGSLCAIVLLMAVGYAAFQTVLNIEGTSNITSSWDIKITNVTSKNIKGTASNNGDPSFENLSATFKTNLQAPGDSIEYDITVTNNGNLNAKLDKYKLTDTNNEAIKFTQTGLTNGEVLTAGSTQTFTVKVEYLSIVSEQPSKVTSSLTITLDYSQAENGYTPGDQVASEQLTSNLVTSGDGLYEDTYEPGRYVYKGSNPNNYITFNNEEWRIISVEADGTLKIIKNGSIGQMAWDATGTRNSDTSTYCTNGETYGCNAWAATSNLVNSSDVFVLFFPNGSSESAQETYSGTVTKDSSLNIYLNSIYYKSLIDVSNVVNGNYYIGSPGNGNDEEDILVNLKQIKEYTWNGKVGLINILEYMNATTSMSCTKVSDVYNNINDCNINNWLQTGTQEWTITPNASSRRTAVFDYNLSQGASHNDRVSFNNAVRPVLYLKSDITLSGEGTQSNPYTIK
ncbi:MAG: hypothetical protein ACLR92_01465 [Bacilli bacterium]